MTRTRSFAYADEHHDEPSERRHAAAAGDVHVIESEMEAVPEWELNSFYKSSGCLSLQGFIDQSNGGGRGACREARQFMCSWKNHLDYCMWGSIDWPSELIIGVWQLT